MARITRMDGLVVKDAKASVILHVLDEDIKKAKRRNPDRCVAALACMRDLGATEAHVHLGRTYLRFNGHVERYITSGALRNEIVAFDKGGKFQPGEYVLRKMQPHRATDYKRKRKTGPHKTEKKRKYHILRDIRPYAMVS